MEYIWGNIDEAYGLLEQAISTLEIIRDFNGELLNLNELTERTIKKIIKAQELLRGK